MSDITHDSTIRKSPLSELVKSDRVPFMVFCDAITGSGRILKMVDDESFDTAYLVRIHHRNGNRSPMLDSRSASLTIGWICDTLESQLDEMISMRSMEEALSGQKAWQNLKSRYESASREASTTNDNSASIREGISNSLDESTFALKRKGGRDSEEGEQIEKRRPHVEQIEIVFHPEIDSSTAPDPTAAPVTVKSSSDAPNDRAAIPRSLRLIPPAL